MTSIGFIVRRLLKSIGLCDKQTHNITASRLAHLLSEKEESLGFSSWEDTNEILQLSENYWELKELFHEQENLEMDAQKIKERNDHLTHKANELETDSESSLFSVSTEKNNLIQKSIELNNKIKSEEEHCETTKKRFIALNRNLHKSETQNNIENLKDEYTLGKQRIGKLKLQIKENDLRLERAERKIKDFKINTRDEISEAMNKVTKSSKLVADYSAKVGAIETAKKEICMKIGSFLSNDENSNNPQIIAVLNKNKLLMDKIKDLKKSITFHKILGK